MQSGAPKASPGTVATCPTSSRYLKPCSQNLAQQDRKKEKRVYAFWQFQEATVLSSSLHQTSHDTDTSHNNISHRQAEKSLLRFLQELLTTIVTPIPDTLQGLQHVFFLDAAFCKTILFAWLSLHQSETLVVNNSAWRT